MNRYLSNVSETPFLGYVPRVSLLAIAGLVIAGCVGGQGFHGDASVVDDSRGAGGASGSGGEIGTGGSAGTGGAPGTGGLRNTGGMLGGGAGALGAGGSAGAGGVGGVRGSAGGSSGAGGMTSTGGSVGTAGSSGVCSAPIASTSTRPQLTSAEAVNFTIGTYLAKSGPFASPITDNWDPTAGLGDASSLTPNFTVAADGSGTHTTVQAALGAATGSARRYILVKPGTYREQLSYSGATPVTIYGEGTDATQVVIIHNMSAAQGASQTFAVRSNGFQIMNMTISNDFPTPASGTNIQALALQTTGDKIVLQNVRLHGFQDTVQLQSPSATTIARVYIKNSYIEGDTDCIFGNATVVIDGSEIHYLSSRRGASAGVILAPSTSVDNSLGFLLIRCNFTADAMAPTNTNHLGRSWDSSGTTPTPNGQAVIRESSIGAYINRAAPWTAAATTARPYSATGNRFNEYCNSGPGAAP